MASEYSIERMKNQSNMLRDFLTILSSMFTVKIELMTCSKSFKNTLYCPTRGNEDAAVVVNSLKKSIEVEILFIS